MNKLVKSILAAGSLALISSGASAHVWNIGFKAQANGDVTFYGVSWHGGAAPGGVGSVDDFTANPAGFVINGTQLLFDLGSVTNLNDCSGAGGLTAGTCSPVFNGLNLDGAIHAVTDLSNTYGKYATLNLNPTQLGGLGITAGSNQITFTTYSPNATWAPRTFDSATVPITIIVKAAYQPGPSTRHSCVARTRYCRHGQSVTPPQVSLSTIR